MFLPTNITLKFGDSGDFVAELQRRLSIVHCFNADGINGFFDGPTVNGVSQFQSMSGIRADGIAGPETLRRLNGTLSGDSTSESDHKAEEEARIAQQKADEFLRLQLHEAEMQRLAEEQALQQQAAIAAAQQTSYVQQPAAPVMSPVEQALAAALQHQYQPPQAALQPEQQPQHHQPVAHQPQPQAQQPTPEPLPMAQAAQPHVPTQQHAPQQTQAAPAVNAAELLASLLAQPIPAAQAPAPQPVAQSAPQTAAPASQQQAAPQPYVPPQQQAAGHQQAAPAQAYVPPQQQVPAQPYVPPQQQPVAQQQAAYQEPAQQQQAVAAQEQPRGIVGRAMQYANAMVQKLANYFEEKLPAPVLNEVKQIGHAMANSGVREAAIPTGPEQQQQRGIEGPAKGQQQVQQRG